MLKFICKLLGHPFRKEGWTFSPLTYRLEKNKCPICEGEDDL